MSLPVGADLHVWPSGTFCSFLLFWERSDHIFRLFYGEIFLLLYIILNRKHNVKCMSYFSGGPCFDQFFEFTALHILWMAGLDIHLDIHKGPENKLKNVLIKGRICEQHLKTGSMLKNIHFENNWFYLKVVPTDDKYKHKKSTSVKFFVSISKWLTHYLSAVSLKTLVSRLISFKV